MAEANSVSKTRLRRLNRRQRKKLHVGEFQEFVFEVFVRFKAPLNAQAWDGWIDALCEYVDQLGLGCCGFGGPCAMVETEGLVQKRGPGSPSLEQGHALIDWLHLRPEVQHASIQWSDAWHDSDGKTQIVLTVRESTQLLELLENPPGIGGVGELIAPPKMPAA